MVYSWLERENNVESAAIDMLRRYCELMVNDVSLNSREHLCTLGTLKLRLMYCKKKCKTREVDGYFFFYIAVYILSPWRCHSLKHHKHVVVLPKVMNSFSR